MEKVMESLDLLSDGVMGAMNPGEEKGRDTEKKLLQWKRQVIKARRGGKRQ